MPKSTTEEVTKSSEKPRSCSRSTHVPLHFTVHKPGCHFESCCGICNLFPGVLLIAFCQVLAGSVLLTLILTLGKQYDEMHQTKNSQCKTYYCEGSSIFCVEEDFLIDYQCDGPKKLQGPVVSTLRMRLQKLSNVGHQMSEENL
jgi:hypothetical protein